MRRQRGSAYIFVLLIVMAVTIVGLATADASMSFVLTQRRAEDTSRGDAIMQGALATYDAIRRTTNITPPYHTDIVIDGISTAVDVAVYAPDPMQRAVTLKCDYHGRTFTKTVFVMRYPFSPFQFALASNNKIDTDKLITSGLLGAQGSVYSAGTLKMTNILNQINGDADGNTVTVSGTVTGTKNSSFGALLFPVLVDANYTGAATTTLAGNQTLNGYTFPAVAAGAPYPVVVITGNLDIKGTITGVGTFYVTGKVTVSGLMTYANASSCMAIISPQDMDMNAVNTVGYYYSGGKIQLNGAIASTVTRGGLASIDEMKFNRGVVITLDPWVPNDSNEGVRLHLPSYWP